MQAAYLHAIKAGETLSTASMERLTHELLDGIIPEAEAISILTSLSTRGETASELMGAYHAIMARALPFSAPDTAIDVCGTGGDGMHSLNISTTAAFIIAACKVPVVKHGNRAISSRSGASDVLASLGFRPSLPASFWQHALTHHHLAFLYAPMFHPDLARIAPLRKRIGSRTLFNLLGPLCNPANVKQQLVGVYAQDKIAIMAEILRQNGSKNAWIVHAEDGSDEISCASITRGIQIENNAMTHFTINPLDTAMEFYPIDSIKGSSSQENALAMIDLFTNPKPSGYYTAALLNAAAGLVIARHVSNLTVGVATAREVLMSGAVLSLLKTLQQLAQEENSNDTSLS